MPKVNVKVVTWDDIVSWTRELAERISVSGWTPDVVVAIARGGYVPARLLCDFLGVSDMVSIQVVHWPAAAQAAEKAHVKYGVNVDLSGRRALIVDDIIDTGDSVALAREYVQGCCNPSELRTAALQVITSVAKFIPDYYVVEVKEWAWFQYPWTAVEDISQFVLRVVRETGRRRLSLGDLVSLFDEWYGRELVEKRFPQLRRAIHNLAAQGYIEVTSCGDVECIEVKGA